MPMPEGYVRCACRHCGDLRRPPETQGCLSVCEGLPIIEQSGQRLVHLCSACEGHFVQRKMSGRPANLELRDRKLEVFLAGWSL